MKEMISIIVKRTANMVGFVGRVKRGAYGLLRRRVNRIRRERKRLRGAHEAAEWAMSETAAGRMSFDRSAEYIRGLNDMADRFERERHAGY